MDDRTLPEAELAAWRAAYRDLQEPGSSRCPSDDALVELILGEVPQEGGDRLADHVTGCRSCSERFRLLSELHEESRPHSLSPPRRRWLPLVAAAALSLVIGWWWTITDRPNPENPEVMRSTTTMAVTPTDGASGEAPSSFAWQEVTAASGYRFQLHDPAANLIWQSASLHPRIELPATVRALLRPGHYTWQVEVEGPVRDPRLGPFRFQVRE